ncbi:MAG TPA: hypothetical protein VMW56_17075 [Candidatus Margulisiibacteriota bacterium]|nr:hypothetical protein [Candidatus Margulisiibacteriota bacterium]
MPKTNGGEKTVQEPTVANRWWVDLGGTEKVKVRRPSGPAGSQFFQVAHDFEQERARERLTDNNLRLLRAADPPEGGWGYVRLAETSYPERELERVKRLVALPAYARAVIVDCGRSVRLLITATPPGERLLELALGEAPSFDCWVHHEWVREAVFEDADKALRALREFIREYLSPEGIAHAESIAARA